MSSTEEVSEKKAAPLEVTATVGGVQELRLEHHISLGRDAAAKLADHEQIDPRAFKTVRWKADLMVCSIMVLVYMMMYMDKVSNSDASIMGIIEDLDMHGNMYSWVGTSFYFGYLGFQLLGGNVLMQHLPIGLASGSMVLIWGVIVCCLGAVHNYASLIGLRVLQGVFEGCMTPSYVMISAQWWPRKEQFSRSNTWYSGVGLGAILVDVLAYGLYVRESSPMTPWRLVFIILGVITIGLAMIYMVIVPSSPATAWFLTQDEKYAAVERVRDNKQGFGSSKTKWYQVREALIDPRTWLYLASVIMLNIPNGGITNFNAIIINNMGYSTAESLLMDMPSGACQFVGQLFIAVVSERFFNNFRMLYVLISGGLNIMSLCFLAFGSNRLGLAGYYIWGAVSPICYCGLLSAVASNSAGTTKKAVVASVLMIGYCVGNLIGPQTFKDTEAPSYTTAKTTMAACSCAAEFLFILIVFLNLFENRRRDRKNEKLPPEIVDPEFADLTDFENPEFRYAM